VIRAAAQGQADERAVFASRYARSIRAYLGARWRGSPLLAEIDDATQEVFVECFKSGGALDRADPDRGGFRAFLYGVTRNVARRAEQAWSRRERQPDSRVDLGEVEGRDENASRVFDRVWAESLMEQARALQASRAAAADNGGVTRLEILRLRFEDGLPVREIAKRLEEDPARVHHEYAKARKEFRQALVDVVREHQALGVRDAEAECARLVQLLR
jgi:RNA polymerase sigma-70 factor (ECF subfamily)